MALDKRDAEFVNSTRGQYIISHALGLAVEVLKKARINKDWSTAHPSNERDMTYLYTNVFNIHKSTTEALKTYENIKSRTKNLLHKKNK